MIVVGYNLTDVFIFEGSNMVQLTIATSKPRKSVPVETSYYLIVNTLDGTATGLPLSLEFDCVSIYFSDTLSLCT